MMPRHLFTWPFDDSALVGLGIPDQLAFQLGYNLILFGHRTVLE